jgi:hypothetical protein
MNELPKALLPYKDDRIIRRLLERGGTITRARYVGAMGLDLDRYDPNEHLGEYEFEIPIPLGGVMEPPGEVINDGYWGWKR